LAALALVSLSAAAMGDRVDLVDLRSMEGDVVSVDQRRAVIEMTAALPESAPASGPTTRRVEVARDELSALERAAAADPMAKTGQKLLTGPNGLVLPVGGLAVDQGKVSFDNAVVGTAAAPMSAVGMIYLPGKLSPREVDRVLAKLDVSIDTRDILIVEDKPGQYVAVDGVLKTIDAKLVTFAWKDEDRQIHRDKVLGVRLAGASAAREAPVASVVCTDGTSLPAASFAMDAAAATARTPAGEVSIAAEQLAAVRFLSSRVTELSDLTPVKVREQGLLDKTFPHRVGRSVSGGPLRLGGKTYSSGLGLHSYCELTYKVEGYSMLVAQAGIDDSVRPHGLATLSVLGDGKPLCETMVLSGKTPPGALRVDVSGVKELTLRVDFGADNQDVADHVNLAPARLLK
jgi:hypothetical protein